MKERQRLTGVRIFIVLLVVLFCVEWETTLPFMNLNGNVQSKRQGQNVGVVTTNKMEEVFERYRERIPELARELSVGGLPSRERPFAFFHLRKTSGTGTRSELFNASDALGIPGWVNCFGHVNCQQYIVPVKSRIGEFKMNHAIYAGHLYYSDVKNVIGFGLDDKLRAITSRGREFELPQEEAEEEEEGNDGDDNEKKKNKLAAEAAKKNASMSVFDCLVSVRPTVDRVVSCWSFRFERFMHTKPAKNLTAEEWRRNLPSFYSHYLEGCNNEFVRALGTLGDEEQVNTLTSGVERDNRESIAVDQLETILLRLSKCVPMMRKDRCNDSQTILNHYFSWFEPFSRCNEGEETFQKPTGTEAIVKLLSNESKAEILRQNTVDEYAYRFSELWFEALLEIASKSNQTNIHQIENNTLGASNP